MNVMTTNKVKAPPQKKKEKGEKITLLRPPFKLKKLKREARSNKLYESCKH